MDDDKEKIVEKYGNWAQFMTESEAKSMLNDYGKVMQIMKDVLEDVFGEGRRYSIDDGQGDDGGGLTISGDLDGIASFTATLRSRSTDTMFSFYYELPKLDCDASEIEDEIQRLEDDDIFSYYDRDPWLEMEVEDDDEDYASIQCYWTFYCAPMFEGVPTMDELIEFTKEFNDLIEYSSFFLSNILFFV